MIGLKVNGQFLKLPDNLKLRLSLTSPLINRGEYEGEYSFPIRIPYEVNATIFNFQGDLIEEGSRDQTYAAQLYAGPNLLLYSGYLRIHYFGKPFIDANFVCNSSSISLLKNFNLNQLEWGELIDTSFTQQSITWQIDSNWVGGTLQCVVEGHGQFTQLVGVDIEGSLQLLANQFNGVTFFGNKTITVNVNSDTIQFVADWGGIEPEMIIFFNSQRGRTQSIVDQVNVIRVLNADYKLFMQKVNNTGYPQYPFVFFPVLNLASQIPHNLIQDMGTIETYIQNFYDHNAQEFSPYIEREVPGFSGFTSIVGGVTPFPYVKAVIDKMAEAIGNSASGHFHQDFPFVLWSNHIVGKIRSTYSQSSTLTSSFYLKDVMPDVNVLDFLNTLCNTFASGFHYTNLGTTINFIKLSQLVTGELGILDWTGKVDTEHLNYTERLVSNYNLVYEDKNDQDIHAFHEERKEKLEFLGVFPTVASLPQVFHDFRLEPYLYAFAIETAQLYVRTFNDPNWTWEVVVRKPVAFSYPRIVDESTNDATDVAIHYPLDMFTGVDEFGPAAPDYKVPISKHPLSEVGANMASINMKACSFLAYMGLQKNSAGNDYPMGATDGKNLQADKLAPELYWQGEFGLFNYYWKEWLNFLLNTEKVELIVNLNMLDLFQLDFTKQIQIRGQRYLLYDVQIELPIEKPSKVILLKIL